MSLFSIFVIYDVLLDHPSVKSIHLLMLHRFNFFNRNYFLLPFMHVINPSTPPKSEIDKTAFDSDPNLLSPSKDMFHYNAENGEGQQNHHSIYHYHL